MITKRLLDVCDFQGGTQPPKEEWINDPRDGYVRMLQIRDYSQGDAKFIQYVKDTKKLHKCKKDDIMLSRYGYIGQAFMGLEGAYNVALVKVIKKEEIHTPYLLYYFQSYYFQHFLLSNVGARATIPGFNKDELENALIRIPEMKEQVEIASKIAKVDELIDFHKQQLDILETLIKSRFIEMFGECEEHKRLEEYANLITKGASPKWQGVDYCEEGTLFVTSENVREGYLDLSKRKYLDNKINEIQPRSMLKRNDILINIVGASIGRTTVYDCDEVANINQAVALVRVDYSQINQTYLTTFLNSPQAIEMYGKMKKGGARDNLSLQNIADLQIPVASIDLQNQFAAFVEQTDKSKFEIQKSLEKLEILKKSLMQQYFG